MMEMEEDTTPGSSGVELQEPIVFKKKTRRNLRARNVDDQDEESGYKPGKEDEDLTEKVELYKELRKLRQRPRGVSAVALALGKKVNAEEEVLGSDPFKSQTGGMIDMDALKKGKFKQTDDAYDTGIGTQFSAETNTRDEDAEMLKYIEEKLQQHKQATASKKQTTEDDEEVINPKFLSPEDAALLSLPEHLRKSSSKGNEEMLSNQMLSGIPEVDLGIEVKIKNIEATEEAKQKILRDRLSKKEGPSVFVPTNMAVNFVQHNRFNIEDPLSSHQKKRPRIEKETPKPKKVVVVGAEPEEVGGVPVEKERGEKATDDFHFEKFKKQFRRF
ncbi:hypothetical protein Ocin01_06596 [Orchesella cincta]|uniref:Telomere length and silencing protein 1 n=1 Tax=Orchesella cincta TaxID=48709 RepID=A0A1D2N497_ORCCI|nr:hypothetical protein Ocin01_06596 [Orchesella cincta]